MDSIFTNLDQLKTYMYQWQYDEGTAYANALYLSLVRYVDRAEMEYKLNIWFPTISGTKYIDFIWYMGNSLKNGLSWDQAYEDAVTTWSGQEYPAEDLVLYYP